MGRIHALKRLLITDHFKHNQKEFSLPIEMVMNGLSVSYTDWPAILPSWGADIDWQHNRATIPKKLKTHNEWFSIAFDFDGVINPYPPKKPFPYMGQPDPGMVQIINKLFVQGFCIIIWTVRGGKLIKPLKKYLHDNGILFHYVNENPGFDIKYKNLSRKIAASVYVDDRNVHYINDPDAIYDQIIFNYKDSLPVDPRQCGVGIEANT